MQSVSREVLVEAVVKDVSTLSVYRIGYPTAHLKQLIEAELIKAIAERAVDAVLAEQGK